jgi:hypothetical protein
MEQRKQEQIIVSQEKQLPPSGMPIYERENGEHFQVIGGSILSSETEMKVDIVKLPSGEHLRKTPGEAYDSARRVA